jgi:hypothetical protein
VQHQVNILEVPDYLEFVRPEDEMWLKLIETKIRKLAYSTREQFLGDFRQMVANCRAYNSDGCGKFPGQGDLPLITFSPSFLHHEGVLSPPPPLPSAPFSPCFRVMELST